MSTKFADLRLDSNLASVDRAEQLVLDAGRRMGFQEEELVRLGLAVHESMVNAVVHGNRYSEDKKVRLVIECYDDAIAVTLCDEGDGFDPDLIPDPLDERNLLRPSGRGVLLIRAFVDEYTIRRLSPSGTEARLVKYLTRT